MSHSFTNGYCFGETQILIALIIIAVIVSMWLTGNLQGPSKRPSYHHPTQGVVWSTDPQYNNNNISVGVATNGDTVMAIPASSTVTATNVVQSDPMNVSMDSVTVPGIQAPLVPDDNSVTQSNTAVTGSQDTTTSLDTTTTPQSQVATTTSYFKAPKILVDANGDPLPRRYQPFAY